MTFEIKYNATHDEHECDKISFVKGKLYKIVYESEFMPQSPASRYDHLQFFKSSTKQNPKHKLFLDKEELLMFVEYQEGNDSCFESAQACFLWKDELIYFKGGFCTHNFEPVGEQ